MAFRPQEGKINKQQQQQEINDNKRWSAAHDNKGIRRWMRAKQESLICEEELWRWYEPYVEQNQICKPKLITHFVRYKNEFPLWFISLYAFMIENIDQNFQNDDIWMPFFSTTVFIFGLKENIWNWYGRTLMVYVCAGVLTAFQSTMKFHCEYDSFLSLSPHHVYQLSTCTEPTQFFMSSECESPRHTRTTT